LDFGLGGHPRFQILLKLSCALRFSVTTQLGGSGKVAGATLQKTAAAVATLAYDHDFPTRAAGEDCTAGVFAMSAKNCRSLTLLVLRQALGSSQLLAKVKRRTLESWNRRSFRLFAHE